MSHISELGTDLATLTTLTITVYPEELALGEGYLLYPSPLLGPPRAGTMYTEEYMVRIGSSSLANLETAITKFLNCDSYMSVGYKYATAGHATWLECTLYRKSYNVAEFFALIKIDARYSTL